MDGNSNTKLKTFEVSVKGLTPLLMDRFRYEESVVKSPVLKPEDFISEAGDKVYRDAEGRAVIPVANLLACLSVGGRFVEYDRETMFSTDTSSMVTSFISIHGNAGYGEMILLEGLEKDNNKTGEPWHVDKRVGRNKDGEPVLIIRPKFNVWGFIIKVSVDFFDPLVTETKIREVFREAGRKAGLGVFNPLHRGSFGKFFISEWVRLPEGDCFE